MACGQVLALKGKKHAQDAVAFLAKRKAHRIGLTLGRQPATGLRVAQVAA